MLARRSFTMVGSKQLRYPRYLLSMLMIILGSCRRNEVKTVQYILSGNYRIGISSVEYYKSGIKNMRICVLEAGSKIFSDFNNQCFFEGFDIDDLEVSWLNQENIQVTFSCGRVSLFRNDAVVSSSGQHPVAFHVLMTEHCKPYPDYSKQKSPI